MHPFVDPPLGRLRLTGYAGLQVLAFVPLVLLFVGWVVGGVLMIFWVGALLLFAVIPASRWLAGRHRDMAADVLGMPLPASYATTDSRNPLVRLRTVALDPMTWRELGWMLAAMTAGFAISLTVVVLLLALVTWWIWYYAVGPLMRLRSVIDREFLSPGTTARLEERVERLAESRAGAVDDAAAELRRLERDLHDGPQARLVALSLNLGMAESVFDRDPQGARRLLREARGSSNTALDELRSVVRGIHPPVLADRGLVGAVQALALDLAVPTTVDAELAGRPAAPVESAVYFAVAEALANVGKHSGASRARVLLRHDGETLVTEVEDDGHGGADPGRGSGLRGVARRLAAFDGTIVVTSPTGGPTTVTLEVPCALSSPRTTPSSGPG